MTSRDIDERSCESFHDDIPLMDSEKDFLRNVKSRHSSKATLIIYVLVAHALGWILALQVPWSFNRPLLTGGDDANRIVPPIGVELVRFDFKTDDWVPGPNDPNVTDTIFDNWTKMLPKGQGMVKVPNFNDFPYLTKPTVLINDEIAYNTAWVHQLHCLYWVMREYHRVLHHGPDGTEYFIDPTHNSYHTSHCFNYIRQAILCGLDTTLEGSGEGVGVADGSGQTHVCRSREQSIEWLEEHKFINWRAIM